VELRDSRPAHLSEPERPFPERVRDVLTGGDKTPPVVTPPAGNPRYPLMDGIRAIAAIAVLTTHAAFASNPNPTNWYGHLTARLDVGVAIFFAIAGFLLFRPYVSDHVDGVRAPGFRRYLFRRGLRVLPAYWVALLVFVMLGLITLDSRWWEHAGLVQVYDSQEVFGGIVPAWSLATEVAFYLALPLFVLVMRGERAGTRIGRLRTAAWIAGALWLGSLAFRLILRGLNHGHPSVWFNALPGTLDWFAIGMGLAVLSVWLARSNRRPRLLVMLEQRPGLSWLAALALFAFVSYGLGATGTWGEARTTAGWLVMHALYGLIALLVLAPAVFPGEGKGLVHQALANPIVAGLGVVSYGLFLYNGPIAVWLAGSGLAGMWAGKPFLGILLVTLVLTIVAAALSYRLVERPLLALKNWRPADAPAPPQQGEAERQAG
jgi:peptidoglycan/LPS O-acetylase OafA/YrhL